MAQPQSTSFIAGSVLPIKRAEELLATLPGVIAARIIAGETGAVDEIHLLTNSEVAPKQTVRNVESALIAHLGMRVDHRKISVATSLEGRGVKERGASRPEPVPAVGVLKAVAEPEVAPMTAATPEPLPLPVREGEGKGTPAREAGEKDLLLGAEVDVGVRRVFYFEDVEVSRSRSRGLTCRVTLAKGGKSFSGEAEGMENERSRVDLAARAALRALADGDVGLRPLDLAGARVVEAFDREFVFVGVTVQHARASVLLTGSCEMKDSPETAAVLAVLDATNRWLSRR